MLNFALYSSLTPRQRLAVFFGVPVEELELGLAADGVEVPVLG